MKKAIFITVLITIILAGCPQSKEKVQRKNEPDVYMVDDMDEAMNIAMEKARETIDDFTAALENPGSSQNTFNLKVRIEDKDQIEHMWLTDVQYSGGNFTGILANEPLYVTNVQYGQELEVSLEEVSDWMYIDGNRLIGGYTIRVLRDDMSDKDRKEFDNMMGLVIE